MNIYTEKRGMPIMDKRIIELESLLKAAEDNASLGIWEWDINTNIITLSQTALEISCIDPSKFDGSIEYLAENIIHKDFRATFEEAVRVALEDKQIAKMEYRLSCPSNLTKWVRVNGVYIFDEDGQPLKMVGMIQDISALKFYEAQLENDSEFLDTLLEIIQNPIFYKDSEGRYQFCNTAFSEYLGFPKSRIIGSTVYDVAPEDLADVYHKADLDLMEQRGHQVYEAQVKYADGSIHDVVFNKAVHTDSNGEVMGLVGVMLDVTEQNKIKKQIADMNILKEALIEINQNIVNYPTPTEMYESLLEKLVEVIEPAEGGCIIELSGENAKTLTKCQSQGAPITCEIINDIDTHFLLNFIKNTNGSAAILNSKEYRTKGDVFPPFVICRGEHAKTRLILPIIYNEQLAHIITLASSKEDAYNESHLDLANYILEQTPIMYQVFTLYQKTLHLSQYDVLTNLINRRHFEEIFIDRLRTAQREVTNLLLVSFDLNGLKSINDTYGHQAGDLYINAFVEYVSGHFRGSDRFARTGGDEFAALFSGTSIDIMLAKLNDIQLRFSKTPITFENQTFYGSYSYGIAIFPDQARTIRELEKLADERMYEDKRKYKESQ